MKTGTCTYQVRTCVHFFGIYNDSKNNIVVEDRDPNKVAIPDKAYAFVFYDEVVAEVKLEIGTVALKNEATVDGRYVGWLNKSSVHYCGGRLFTVAEGERFFREHASAFYGTGDPMDGEDNLFDLIRTGKRPGVTHILQQRNGDITPFCEGVDVIVPLPEPATA